MARGGIDITCVLHARFQRGWECYPYLLQRVATHTDIGSQDGALVCNKQVQSWLRHSKIFLIPCSTSPTHTPTRHTIPVPQFHTIPNPTVTGTSQSLRCLSIHSQSRPPHAQHSARPVRRVSKGQEVLALRLPFSPPILPTQRFTNTMKYHLSPCRLSVHS